MLRPKPHSRRLQTAGLLLPFLRTPEAARFLGLSYRTLEKHRIFGTGPKYLKLGGRVIYAVRDLREWAAGGAKRSTTDPGEGTIPPIPRRTGRRADKPVDKRPDKLDEGMQ
jgi:predicted DNA-binding transcriptional regulator AlpA